MVGGNYGKEELFQIPSEIKYSSMFEDDPEVWFEGLEAQFAIRKITKPETKYYHVHILIGSDILRRLPRECRTLQRASGISQDEKRDPYEYTYNMLKVPPIICKTQNKKQKL